MRIQSRLSFGVRRHISHQMVVRRTGSSFTDILCRGICSGLRLLWCCNSPPRTMNPSLYAYIGRPRQDIRLHTIWARCPAGTKTRQDAFHEQSTACDGNESPKGESSERQHTATPRCLFEPISSPTLSSCADMQRCTSAVVSRAAEGRPAFLSELGRPSHEFAWTLQTNLYPTTLYQSRPMSCASNRFIHNDWRQSTNVASASVLSSG